MPETITSQPEDVETTIVAWLDKQRKRDRDKDCGDGIRTARKVGEAVGLTKTAAKAVLLKLAGEGRVRHIDCLNGMFWQGAEPDPIPNPRYAPLSDLERARLEANIIRAARALPQLLTPVGQSRRDYDLVDPKIAVSATRMRAVGDAIRAYDMAIAADERPMMVRR